MLGLLISVIDTLVAQKETNFCYHVSDYQHFKTRCIVDITVIGTLLYIAYLLLTLRASKFLKKQRPQVTIISDYKNQSSRHERNNLSNSCTFYQEKHSVYSTKRIRKVSTICEYFRRSVEVVISRMRAVFPHSLASHRRQYEISRQNLRIVLCV